MEAVYSGRALRELGHRLAASGWAAVRIDYAGMGDSVGTWTDGGLVAEWLRGIRDAIDYARSLGAPRVAVVGLRLGATLAAAELAHGGGVDDLVLWDPCAKGKAFLREQRAMWTFLRTQATQWGTLGEDEQWGSGGVTQDGSLEAPGLMFSAQTVSDLEPIAIAPGDRALATRELLIARQGRRLDRLLVERQALPHVESEESAGQEVLLDVSAITPEPTLERIVSWLGEPGGPVSRLRVPEARTAAVIRVPGRPGVRERPLEMGPARLFGMLSEPEEAPGTSAPTVVFLNTGRIGHQGPARLWVELARAWAAEGLRCVRVDLSGLGDSPTRPGRTELVELPADALDDLDDIRRAVDVGGDLVLVGLCSGGYHAIESALRSPVASVCLVNPVIAYLPWTQHPDRRFEPNEESSGPGGTQARESVRPWKARLMARATPLRDSIRRIPGVWWILNRLHVTPSRVRPLERLVGSGVDVLLVAGGRETCSLCRGETGRFRALARQGGFTLETIPDLEHSLIERTGRDQVAEVLHAHIRRLRPALRGAVSSPDAAPR